MYADPSIQKYLYCGYDSQGNLFVDGISYGIGYIFAELPEGSASFTNITLDPKIGSGLVQWDGSYITIEVARDPTIYRIAVSGSSGTVVGTTTLYTHVGKLKAYALTWIQGNTVVGGHWGTDQQPYKDYEVGYWRYPKGGNAFKLISGLSDSNRDYIDYTAVSLAPR